MQELSAEGICELTARRTGVAAAALTARELGGGVSNRVWLVAGSGVRLVVKQALPKLRVKEDWFSDPTRILREAAALRRLSAELSPGDVPQILFEDRDQFVYGMQAAPAERTWKEMLLGGEASIAIAAKIAGLQGRIITTSWRKASFEAEFGQLDAFEQLRIAPYYEFTASKYPDSHGLFQRAITRARVEKHCLVHGDWSPKNLMVSDHGNVTAIDFEVIHYGDPTFDCAFLLNHLVLKCVYKPEYRDSYRAAAESYWMNLISSVPVDGEWLWDGVLVHLPALLLARVDGKSPVEYLSDGTAVRALAFRLAERGAQSVSEIFP